MKYVCHFHLYRTRQNMKVTKRSLKLEKRTHIDTLRIKTLEQINFNKTIKEEYSRKDYPFLWYNFNFGETTLQIRKGRKGYYIASRKHEDLSLEKEEIHVQSEGHFFYTKEGNFMETCIKWQKYIKYILSKTGKDAAANPS